MQLISLVIELASRPCGANSMDLHERGIPRNTAAATLNRLVKIGRLVRVPAQTCGASVTLNQHFADPKHAHAWRALPVAKRPGMRLQRSTLASTSGNNRKRQRPPAPVAVQSLTWRKAPMVGAPIATAAPKPVQVVTVCSASTVDPRYQIDPAKFKGGTLSRLPIGSYSEPASAWACVVAQRRAA